MKIYTRWVPKLLTQLQSANRVDCCEGLLKNCNQDPIGFFGRIVNGEGGEKRIHHYHPFNQQEAKTCKKSSEKTLTRSQLTRSAGKIIMTICWDCEGVFLVDFLSRGTTINDPYYASLLYLLCSSMREKLRCDVLLFHNNAPVRLLFSTQALPN